MAITYDKFPVRGSTAASQVRRWQLEGGDTTKRAWIRGPAAVTLAPKPGGVARIEYSTSPPELIEAGDGIWLSWQHGNVHQATTAETDGRITAVRAVCETGAAVMEILS